MYVLWCCYYPVELRFDKSKQKLIDKILEEPQNKKAFENMKKYNIISAKKMREDSKD